jgi:hypothetical protein
VVVGPNRQKCQGFKGENRILDLTGLSARQIKADQRHADVNGPEWVIDLSKLIKIRRSMSDILAARALLGPLQLQRALKMANQDISQYRQNGLKAIPEESTNKARFLTNHNHPLNRTHFNTLL